MVWPFSGSNTDTKEENIPNTRRSSERKSNFQFDTIEPIKKSINSTPTASNQDNKQFLLEDTEPRFNNGPAKPQDLPIKEAVNSISLESFKFDNLVKIPCFREAGLTGLSALGVLGTIIFITQKSPSKAANWGVGGFLLGSTVSWEQCRSKRRKEMSFAAQARETVASKERPMLTKQNENLSNDQEKKREEVKSWWSRS